MAGAILYLLACLLVAVVVGRLDDDLHIIWGPANFSADGEVLTIGLTKKTASGFRSNSEYLFGRFDIGLQLVQNESAGTVTTFYLSSRGDKRDEIDFEFLGNVSGQPYVLHTNLFAAGKGQKEQQFYLWFDPTTSYHIYSLVWNRKNIIFYIDGVPIRVFKNRLTEGIPYPISQPMTLYGSIWCADSWATRGGRDKTNWTYAPFVASVHSYRADACTKSSRTWVCGNNASSANAWFFQELDAAGQQQLQNVREKYMIYDYCRDTKRWAKQGFLPPECNS